MNAKYEVFEAVGSGSFAVVHKGVRRSDGRLVALKKLHTQTASWDEVKALPEIKVLPTIPQTANVVRLLEVLRDDKETALVFPFCDYNLFDVLKARRDKAQTFSEDEVRSVGRDILQGLEAVHAAGFLHRDIKPENIMFNKGVAKLADFGQARRQGPSMSPYVSTRWYRAPEVLLRASSYSSAADIWAVGVVLAEMLTMTPLFGGSSDADQLFRISTVLGPAANKWPQANQLASSHGMQLPNAAATDFTKVLHAPSSLAVQAITAMVQWNPEDRPTASQASKLAFFTMGKHISPALETNAASSFGQRPRAAGPIDPLA